MITRERLDEIIGDESEHGEFDRILPSRRLSRRPDLNAMMLLERLSGDTENPDANMICHAGHDDIQFAVTPEDILASATEEDIRDLARCGVSFDGGFRMFV